MNTAQLQLPYDLAEQIQETLSDKSQESNSSTKSSVEVRELMSSEQDDDVLMLGLEMSQDVDLDEHVDPLVVKNSCIQFRADVERLNYNCFIAYQGSTAIGFLVGICMPCLHREGVVAEQKLWYVKPQFRGTWASLKLIRAFERWARLNGATQIFTGTANRRYAERTIKQLNRLGYATCGALLVKEI